MENNEENQAMFHDLMMDIHRGGASDLEDYLEQKTDFLTAPASTRFHGSFQGGLLAHSLATYNNLVELYKMYEFKLSQRLPFDTLIIAGLLHDVCKTNFYRRGTRNAQDPKTGVWQKVPTYYIEDQIPLGHGEKSVILLQQYITLTIDEIYAIRWHMGGFDDAGRSYGGGQALSAAMDRCPLLVLLHMADLAANYIAKV